MENHKLVIMAKAPELGKVKTRLAASFGDEEALKIYKKLLNYTLRESNCALWESIVYFTGKADSEVNTYDFSIATQTGENLGNRMDNAFKAEFKNGAERVAMIGTDCAGLTLGHIERAFGMLKLHDLVLGPANDGGYYLIAMNQPHSELFQNVPWSSEHVLEITKEIAEENHLSMGFLEELVDVDTESDLESYQWLIKD